MKQIIFLIEIGILFKDTNNAFSEQIKRIKKEFKLDISRLITENQYNDSIRRNVK